MMRYLLFYHHRSMIEVTRVNRDETRPATHTRHQQKMLKNVEKSTLTALSVGRAHQPWQCIPPEASSYSFKPDMGIKKVMKGRPTTLVHYDDAHPQALTRRAMLSRIISSSAEWTCATKDLKNIKCKEHQANGTQSAWVWGRRLSDLISSIWSRIHHTGGRIKVTRVLLSFHSF